MSKSLLTIAVPTFNRGEQLRRLLRQLLPQLTGASCLLILDNSSDVPAIVEIEALISTYPGANVRVERNLHNVGANANILRCFERCETKWIWVVGDDDEVAPNALETILEQIRRNPDALLINFPIDESRKVPCRTKGPAAFVDAIDKAADVPWITSTVYRTAALTPNLRFGYQFTYSMLPHIAMLMTSFSEGHEAIFASEHIANRDRAGVTTEQQTPIVNMALGFPVLLDLPIALDLRRKLVKKLLITNDSPGLPLRQLAYQLLLMSLKTGDRRDATYIFDQACRRRFHFDATFRERAEIFAYRRLLGIPPGVVAGLYGLVKRRPMVAQVHQDRGARL